MLLRHKDGLIIAAILFLEASQCEAFVVPIGPLPRARPLSSSVRDIKDELVQMGVKYDDCFDKESLLQRLHDARSGKVAVSEKAPPKPEEAKTSSSSNTEATHAPAPEAESASSPSTKSKTQSGIDRDKTLMELRSMRVKELRQELASRNLRWAGLLEKEDLVQAVLRARIQAAHFSSTGLVTPGQVATLTGAQVKQEAQDASIAAPLLVDAYATWCGPCQMMAPQLQEAAKSWGDKVRVVKFDTDQHPTEASEWRIQGLPTLLLFRAGTQIGRIEGALMKDQLLQWVESELSKA